MAEPITTSTSDRASSLVVRVLATLPPRLQLLLAGGKPVRVDGQELDPEVQLSLVLLRLSRRPSYESLPVPEAREEIRREAAVFAGSPRMMASVEQLSIPGPAGALAARLYVPEGAPAPSPLLVYYHGGGWVLGDLDTADAPCRFLAHEGRVRVLSIHYRRAPEDPFPAAVEDALAAFRFASEQAELLGADPERVGVGGDSAGGNLAAVVARLSGEGDGSPPAFQLLIYPATDLSEKRGSYRLFGEGFFLTERQMDWYRGHYLPNEEAARDPRASPLLASDLAGVPPAHVALAGFDVLRDEGDEYARRLEAHGVPVTVSRHTGLIHGFCNATGVGRSSRRAMLQVAAALRALAALERPPKRRSIARADTA